MTPAFVAAIAFAAWFVGYRFYARWLAQRVFRLDSRARTPAHTLADGVDYVPTRPVVLYGHHFASITGLAPMLGPAVAVIWGWLPAVLWVVLGAIFIGCVHDFAALVVSVRARGLSVGKVAEGVIGPRARTLFLLIILFGIALAMGVFVFVIARLFSLELAPGHPGYPQAVLPSAFLMVVAVVCGWLLYVKRWPLAPVAVAGFVLELGSIYAGIELPTLGLPAESWPAAKGWTLALLGYAFVASVLPVWVLLQSRDFLNSLLLYLGVGLAYFGLFIGNPSFDAPAIVLSPPGAPDALPFVFIVIACGAASGFHGLVSSGTTAKQLDRETHAVPIGYGGMIGESALALLATLACTAGFGSTDAWHDHYGHWASVQGLAANIDAFIAGAVSFIDQLGLPRQLSASLMAMVVVSFALTTLDSATRLLRFNVEELGAAFGTRLLANRWVSSAAAVGIIALFAFYEVNGQPAALALWALFGTTNQLLAGLALILAWIYLAQRGWPVWPVAVPAVFMLLSTAVAMVQNLIRFAAGPSPDPLLLAVGSVLLALAAWLAVESILALRRPRANRTAEIEMPIEPRM